MASPPSEERSSSAAGGGGAAETEDDARVQQIVRSFEEEEDGGGGEARQASGFGQIGRVGLSAISGLRVGLRFATFLSNTGHRIARDVNDVVTEGIHRGADMSEGVLHSGIEAVAPRLGMCAESWKNRVTSGHTVFKAASSTIGAGVGGAIGISGRVLNSVFTGTQSMLTRADAGVKSALSEAGIAVDELRESELLKAAHIVLSVIEPTGSENPLQLGRALMALGALQDGAQSPFPPKNGLPLDLAEESNAQLMKLLARQFRFCLSVYGPTPLRRACGVPTAANSKEELLEEMTGTTMADVVEWQNTAQLYRPCYLLSLDRRAKAVTLTIRGSLSLHDVLTDLVCQTDEAGRHSGMVAAAENLDGELRETVRGLLRKHSDYKLVVQGHSLGGAVATLLLLRWKDDPDFGGEDPSRPRIRAFSFAAPCVASLEVAMSCKQHVTSVVYARDVVSRLSLGSVLNARRMMLHLVNPGAAGDAIRSLALEGGFAFDTNQISHEERMRLEAERGVGGTHISPADEHAASNIGPADQMIRLSVGRIERLRLESARRAEAQRGAEEESDGDDGGSFQSCESDGERQGAPGGSRPGASSAPAAAAVPEASPSVDVARRLQRDTVAEAAEDERVASDWIASIDERRVNEGVEREAQEREENPGAASVQAAGAPLQDASGEGDGGFVMVEREEAQQEGVPVSVLREERPPSLEEAEEAGEFSLVPSFALSSGAAAASAPVRQPSRRGTADRAEMEGANFSDAASSHTSDSQGASSPSAFARAAAEVREERGPAAPPAAVHSFGDGAVPLNQLSTQKALQVLSALNSCLAIRQVEEEHEGRGGGGAPGSERTQQSESERYWRLQIKALLDALRTEYLETDCVLYPAGRVIHLVPSVCFDEADVPVEVPLTEGGCVALECGGAILDISAELLMHSSALPDHLPGAMAAALGIIPPLVPVVPNESASASAAASRPQTASRGQISG
uniref:sn-1-specific diacylglycerol lipase n=1 Tax=Chromera velia CCMP2878 TaxID=1169474 RepID=A0A0G4FYY9_9ALVE|mmetsp:Transcript_43281/g.85386  ORF Transcript_43281/g.85386 Transcript_43281/m.85386 type:complete len:971 (+) Transcript_43281:201-3113(+)|eukprot:Cvel_3903.t1-p1 / transcript=Cvel_3903.t1 / gene=Cvel_3903 / organism=Chromera_velia_CCMP2878 / gene_product=Sn1-specific diacylglycerol lipase alpha, putative / transcript_product=Sn1-specific diacylglycerol lipase alpha, putative / location=Cvel_scaffold165:62125-70005(+) / protein_length=970 / sequence_SO=supercontig / SO=protein_coding / is_pseudo=false